MKTMLAKELINKLKLVKDDISLLNKINEFINDIQKNEKYIIAQSELAENIYVFKTGGVRIFYFIQQDNEGNDVLVLLDFIHKNNLSKKMITNNPRTNSLINPSTNSLINPRTNSLINPSTNSLINPKTNSLINPKTNSLINPKTNSLINPKTNSLINPKTNSLINPKTNSLINPKINPSFKGFIVYDLDLNPKEFIIKANENVMLIFNDKSDCEKFAVKHNSNGFVIFNFSNNEWMEHMVSDGRDGFNIFSLSNEWIGFVQ